jgi:alkylhydroperoxidase/carboxymuconolactone decarboxylase family protein YurZ
MTSLLTILSDRDLGDLARGYDREFHHRAASQMVGYEKASGFASWIGGTVYRDGQPSSSLEHHEREIAILAVAAIQRDTFVLSGHIYWTLMELLRGPLAVGPPALAVEKVADVLLTVGAYAGINNFRLARTVLEDVLKMLKRACEAGECASAQIFPRLAESFPRR